MAVISHKVSAMSLLSLSVMFLLMYCATANNQTNQPSYKMVSYYTVPNKCLFLVRVKRPFVGNIDLTSDITDTSTFLTGFP